MHEDKLRIVNFLIFGEISGIVLFICFAYLFTKSNFVIMQKMLLFAGAMLLASFAWAQSLKPVPQRVIQEKQQFGEFPDFQVFETRVQDLKSRPDLQDQCGEGILLSLDNKVLQTLRNSNPDRLQLTLPAPNGGTFQLDLVRAKSLSPSFTVRAASRPDVAAEVDPGLHYWGMVSGVAGSLVGISIFETEVMGIINTPQTRFVLGALQNERSGLHILYDVNQLKIANTAICDADILEDVSNGPAAVAERAAGPDNCVNMYMEADYTIFQNKGSTAAATTYITGFFSQVSLLYANESVNMVLNELLVWDVADPYTGPSSSNYLTQFRDYLGGVYNGDLAHLVGFTGGGGIAYVDVLCNSFYGVGYSGINTTYSNVPTYSWTVEVVTHEIGHNLGSSHTHACVWNGNNTAIDGCGPTAGYSEGCTAPLPTAGTIMSYCHLVSGVGIDFNLGFGPQPGDRIRSEVYNAPCLTVCGGGGECTYGPVNSQNFDAGWGIWTDGGTDCARINNVTYANSGTYSIQLRDNTTTSVMSTTNQNWSAYEEITVTFSYISVSFDNSNEDFWVQLSTNGGSTYTTKGDFNHGVQFTNGVRATGTVVIAGPFTSTSRLRFRADASADDDQVYIDDVVITGCSVAGARPEDPGADSRFNDTDNNTAVLSDLLLSPNPASDVLDVRYQINKDSEVRVALLGVTGQVLQQTTQNVAAGSNLMTLDLSALPTGLYSLQLICDDQVYTEKVVVRK